MRLSIFVPCLLLLQTGCCASRMDSLIDQALTELSQMEAEVAQVKANLKEDRDHFKKYEEETAEKFKNILKRLAEARQP